MKEIDCNIIRDLLPLYIDNVCSRQSAELVEEHLAACEACRCLRGEMTMEAEVPAPRLEGEQLFKHVFRCLLGITLAAAVMIVCFVANIGGAWMGGPANIGNLVATVSYVVFWSIFSVMTRKFAPLAKVSFALSLVTLISSANSLVCKLLDTGGFLAAFVSVFASVPMYGLCFFVDWTGLYATATVVSLGWLVFTGCNLRKLKH